MTAEEHQGRQITLAIACLAGAVPVGVLVVAILAGEHVPAGAWLTRGVVPIGLSWLLIRGHRWARAITVIGFSVGTLGALLRLSQATTMAAMLTESSVATVDGIAAAALFLSPAVRTYFEFRNRLTSLNLTGA